MSFNEDEARSRFVAARVARLATASADSQPHLVPVTFAARGNVVIIAVDHKPKSTSNLKRLRNIQANERVSLMVDHYDDDWSQLWWVRADGRAKVIEPAAEPVGWLMNKYDQYVDRRPEGPVIWVEVDTWRSWSYL